MAAIPYAILGYGRNREELQDAIDAATAIDLGQIRRGRAPLWWDSPAVYRREEQRTLPGVERIQTAEELHAMGAGDCDDHAPHLAASIQAIGGEARAVVIESPGIGYHVIVVTRDQDGARRIIDPSARRGMMEGEADQTKRLRRRRRIKALLKRAKTLVTKAARLNPTSAAARAIASEARRALSAASAARAADEADENAEQVTDIEEDTE